jgi:hypothetical protein
MGVLSMSQILVALQGEQYFLANEDPVEMAVKIKNIKKANENVILLFGRFVEHDEKYCQSGCLSSAFLVVDKIVGWRIIE